MLPPSLLGFSLPPLEWHELIRTWYSSMRQESPIFYDQEQEYWLIFRYHDVERVLRDHEHFSSEKKTPGSKILPNILTMDPPRHHQLRALLTSAFAPSSIAQRVPRITSIVTDLTNRVRSRGEMDIIADLAAPLPTLVIAEMLGLPLEDVDRINEWTNTIIAAPPEQPSSLEEVRTPAIVLQEMVAYFAQIVAERRRTPRQDLISELLAASVEGDPLNDAEIYGFCFTLLQASHIMTTNVIANALLCFFAHPGTIEQLQQTPALLPTAIEEALRYMPPMRGIGAGKRDMLNRRIALADTEVGGQMIRKDESVNVSIGSANFDESVFKNADTFDVRRTPNRHLSFGQGIHFCMGSQLARLEIQIALNLLFTSFPHIRLNTEVPLVQQRSNVLLGVERLSVLF